MIGARKNAKIFWRKGSTTKQREAWSCGYRTMSTMLSYLKKIEEVEEWTFDSNPPYVPAYPMTVEESDVHHMKTKLAPAFYALSRGWLGFLPKDVFWQPKWEKDPLWDDTLSPFPDVYSDIWFSSNHLELLAAENNNIRVFEKFPSRPQGGRRDDNSRFFIVTVKPDYVESSWGKKISDIKSVEDVIYVQCRGKRHDGAMSSVEAHFHNKTPWLGTKSRKKLTEEEQLERKASLERAQRDLSPQDIKVNYIITNNKETTCSRCKRTGSTQVSGAKKRKLEEEQLRQAVHDNEKKPRHGMEGSVDLIPQIISTEVPEEEGHMLFAPKVRSSISTSPIDYDAPAGDIYRMVTVGHPQLAQDGFAEVSFQELFDEKPNLKDALNYLYEFGSGLTHEEWKETGFWTAEGRYRVRASGLKKLTALNTSSSP